MADGGGDGARPPADGGRGVDEVVGHLRGATGYGADVGPADAAHLVFVRSDVAHGDLLGVDVTGAVGLPGVLGVFTAADLDLPRYTQLPGFADELLQPPLAVDEVLYAGQRVAAVVARDLGSALDAAEAVVVDVDPRPPVLSLADATTTFGSWEVGERHEPRPDDVVVSLELHQPRVAPTPLEPTTACAVPGADGSLTFHVGAQMPTLTHQDLCTWLGLAPERIRVLGVPMGGAFGCKTVGGSPDLSVLAACALRLGRPVRFVEDRSANLAVNQARDQWQRWTLVAGPDGRLRHVDLDAVADAGAYLGTGAVEPATTVLMAAGPYRVPAAHVRARSVRTTTAPTGPYRGPGRAEAATGLERTMDVLAAELALDPVELRRRNLLGVDELPTTSACGAAYDAADHRATLDRALALAEADRWRAARDERRAAGDHLLVGVGVSTWVDGTAGSFTDQQSSLCLGPDGAVELMAGSASAGQGHARAFASLVGRRLGVDPSSVVVALPDSAGPVGSVGSFGSRSGQIVGSAVDRACDALLGQARLLAASLLEADPDDVVVHPDGRLGVAGVPDRALGLAELGRRSHELTTLPDGVEPGLASVGSFTQQGRTHPSGCHVAVVEVDAETGHVRLVRLVSATDCGTVLDEVAVTGQAQGGMVQGAAQALWEEIVYDADGNLATGNLAAYGIPSAAEVPALDVALCPTPTDRNPLGAKGVAESGTVGAPAAVVNAVVDALAHLGVRHVEMPCTPERVWSAVAAARPAGPDGSAR